MKHYTGSCPFCYENVKKRANHRGHVGYTVPRQARIGGLNAMGLQRNRRDEKGPGGVTDHLAMDREFNEKYPTLADFLGLEAWPNGDKRQTGTVLFFVEDGLWKCCLNDRDGDCYSFLSSESFSGLLSGANENLDRNTLEWRYRASKGRKR